MYTLRIAQKSDFEELKKLGEDESFDMTSINRFYEDVELEEFISETKTNIFLVLIVEGVIKGFLYAKLLSKLWVMLDGLYVHPSERNNGYAKKLLGALRVEMTKRKINYVNVLVDTNDLHLKNFLEKQGFVVGKNYTWMEKDPL